MKETKYGDYYTFQDLGLIEESFFLSSPEPVTNFIEIPGRSGSIDMSEALGIGVVYRDRSLEATYVVRQGFDLFATVDRVMQLLHGKRVKISNEMASEHHLIGRINVEPEEPSGHLRRIKITAICEPYYYADSASLVFAFAPETVILPNEFMRSIPFIENEEPITINGISLAPGARKVHALTLEPGDNTFNITGSGMVTISYQQGRL